MQITVPNHALADPSKDVSVKIKIKSRGMKIKTPKRQVRNQSSGAYPIAPQLRRM